MGEGENDLWEDSKLIDAFDDAISKYKIYHNQTDGASSALVNASAVDDESKESRRHKEAGDDNETLSKKTTKMGESVSPVKEKSCTEASGIEQYLDKTTSHVNSQSVEEYNCLLEKYYELEGQRQMVLQQLNEFGHSSTLTTQEHQVYAEQAPNSMVSSFYCPYGCQSWVSPVLASPSCCVGGNCTDKNIDDTLKSNCDQIATSLQQPDIVKTAMGSAEKALSSLSGDLGDEGAPKMSNDHVANESKPETALSEVLHAWYSAGFYTGKYLTEQSHVGKKI